MGRSRSGVVGRRAWLVSGRGSPFGEEGGELFDVVGVVSDEHGGDVADGHFASFWVVDGLVPLSRGEGTEEGDGHFAFFGESLGFGGGMGFVVVVLGGAFAFVIGLDGGAGMVVGGFDA